MKDAEKKSFHSYFDEFIIEVKREKIAHYHQGEKTPDFDTRARSFAT